MSKLGGIRSLLPIIYLKPMSLSERNQRYLRGNVEQWKRIAFRVTCERDEAEAKIARALALRDAEPRDPAWMELRAVYRALEGTE